MLTYFVFMLCKTQYKELNKTYLFTKRFVFNMLLAFCRFFGRAESTQHILRLLVTSWYCH